MSSQIYKTLLQRQIDNFIDTFGQDSNSLFKDMKGKLIHPGDIEKSASKDYYRPY